MPTPLIRRRDWVFAGAASVMVTVLVSWMFALNAVPIMESGVKGAPWPATPPEDWPPASRFTTEHRLGSTWSGYRQWSAWGNQDGTSSGDYHMEVTSTGWPLLAMKSRLHNKTTSNTLWRGEGRWESEPSLAAGLLAPLHWSRPHPSGSEGWGSRRLPLVPLPIGFIVNTACAMVPVMGLMYLWRLPSLSTRRSWIGHPATILLIAATINVVVSAGVWVKWHLASKPGELSRIDYGGRISAASDAMTLKDDLARWPAAVPSSWPLSPQWIGYDGEARGIRGYEFTSQGVPTVALMWPHVYWGAGARDVHQSINVVQAGWPFPSLQSEELVEYEGRAEDDAAGGRWPGPDMTLPLKRRGAIWNVTMPGAPPPRNEFESLPLAPIRPLPLGTFVNVLFYSVIVAPAVWMPAAIRMYRRRRWALCLECGYDVKELAICPECGGRQAGPAATDDEPSPAAHRS